MHNSLTDIPGLKVGHWTDLEAATGCTVILCPTGAVAGVDVRGTAPGTREIALLNPICMVEQVHAVVLSGGSAFGLAAADGVMRWLEAQGIGVDTGVAKVPIVPAAILFDLGVGSPAVRPDAQAGYAACEAASQDPVALGNVGAGTGASVGKVLGFERATKTGLGSASQAVTGQVRVAALVALNAFGEVYDPFSRHIIAGARRPDGTFADTVEVLKERASSQSSHFAFGTNTTLAVIATNARLSKSEATKVAQMAHDGLARTIRPIHTHLDGDTIFALSCGQETADVSLLGTVAADVLAEAVITAVENADSLAGLPAAGQIFS